MRLDKQVIGEGNDGENDSSYNGSQYDQYNLCKEPPAILEQELAKTEVLDPSEELAYYAEQAAKEELAATQGTLYIPSNTGFGAFTSASPVYTMEVTSVDGIHGDYTNVVRVPAGKHRIGYKIAPKGYRAITGEIIHTFEAGKNYRMIVYTKTDAVGAPQSMSVRIVQQSY